MLNKYYIGDVKLLPGEEGAITRFEVRIGVETQENRQPGVLTVVPRATTLQEDMTEGKFYYTTKKLVEAYFKENKVKSAQGLAL